LIRALRQTHLDDFEVCRLILLLPRRGGTHLRNIIVAPACSGRGGPRALTSIDLLEDLRLAGINPGPFCDSVADSRTGLSVAPSTAATYDSHLRQIQRTCRILGECGLPAHIYTIRRVTSVVGHPATLRGWLAAWRRLHCTARLPWAGDRDPTLIAIRVGLRHSLGPAPVRQRCRKQLLRRLLQAAVHKGEWEAGAFAVICYTFGLRAPSELVGQAARPLFVCKSDRISYGPIKRKGQEQPQTLTRWCVCKVDRLLCVYDWLELLLSRSYSHWLFPGPSGKYMDIIIRLLQSIGHPEAAAFTTHC